MRGCAHRGWPNPPGLGGRQGRKSGEVRSGLQWSEPESAGTRTPEVYGRTSLIDVEKLIDVGKMCQAECDRLDLELAFRQSNHEGSPTTRASSSTGSTSSGPQSRPGTRSARATTPAR